MAYAQKGHACTCMVGYIPVNVLFYTFSVTNYGITLSYTIRHKSKQRGNISQTRKHVLMSASKKLIASPARLKTCQLLRNFVLLATCTMKITRINQDWMSTLNPPWRTSSCSSKWTNTSPTSAPAADWMLRSRTSPTLLFQRQTFAMRPSCYQCRPPTTHRRRPPWCAAHHRLQHIRSFTSHACHSRTTHLSHVTS